MSAAHPPNNAWSSGRAVSWARRLVGWWPWTWRGMALAVVIWVAVQLYGLDQVDLVLLVLGGAAAGLLALSTLVVVAGALLARVLIKRASQSSQSSFETGVPLRSGFSIPALGWIPLLQFDWETVSDEAEATHFVKRGRIHERLTFLRRGKHNAIKRRLHVQDAFRLARISQTFSEPHEFKVSPHTGQLRHFPSLTSFAAGDEMPHPMGVADGDRVELRRYVPGDSARFIHWKVFGRTRKLMVRVPERALARSRRTQAYLVVGPRDDASAAAARFAIESDALGIEWRFSADGCGGATSEVAEAVDMVVRSAAAASSQAQGAGLRAFVESDRGGPASLIVFAPASSGPWVDAVCEIARPRAGITRVVIGVDAMTDWKPRSRIAKFFVRSVDEDATPRDEIDEIAARLRASRCELVLADRATGRLVQGALRDFAAREAA